jgi:ABC-type uncharacterized transport system permease subunit
LSPSMLLMSSFFLFLVLVLVGWNPWKYLSLHLKSLFCSIISCQTSITSASFFIFVSASSVESIPNAQVTNQPQSLHKSDNSITHCSSA